MPSSLLSTCDTIRHIKHQKKHEAMPLPTKPNPRRYTATTKLSKSTYLSLVNEAERMDVSLSTMLHHVIERGMGAQK